VDLVGVSEALNRIQTEMSDRITAMMRELELLRDLQVALKSVGETITQVQHELAETKQKLSSVEIQLRSTGDDRDAARRDLQRSTERVLELTAALETLRTDTDTERKRLGQQIAANATGRIEEFKNRLGLNLSRLVVDLPDAGMSVSSELGKVLLLQFHQFLDALGQEGIETRPRVRSK
jgi:septal ring factor EnvC (AmiA/AmiB activator)